MHHICERCLVYKMAKSKASSNGLYTLLPIPTTPWIDISMDFVLGLPRTQSDKNSIFVVVDRFSNIEHFIPCHKSDDACHVANLFIREVLRLHKLPKSIVSKKDSKFLTHFWRTLCEFVYNRVVNKTTSHIPFKLVYGYNPLSPLDLVPLLVLSKLNSKGLSKAQFIVRLHERARMFKERQGKKFPFLRKFKLLPRGARPFLVLKRINDKTYVLDMPQEFGDQEESERDLAGTTRESLQGLLTRGRLKKLEAKVQRNKDLLRGQRASKTFM
ncbi:hypothetical protein CR513_58891, partial [Mucuna pruriens]